MFSDGTSLRSIAASIRMCAICAESSAHLRTVGSGSREFVARVISTPFPPRRERGEEAVLHHLSMVLASPLCCGSGAWGGGGACGWVPVQIGIARSDALRHNRHGILLSHQPVFDSAFGEIGLCGRGHLRRTAVYPRGSFTQEPSRRDRGSCPEF